MIDLRSDTVTVPTDEMRRAMAEAEVGDDVYGEDPTVRTLEEETASALGKEAALYVPSGVMANQTAVKVHTQPGDEVVVESEAHILMYESGAAPMLSGVQLRQLRGDRGAPSPADVEALQRGEDAHVAPLRLLCLENTHNRAGGLVLGLEIMAQLRRTALRMGMRVHLDGARIWNAAAALRVPASAIAQHADSVAVCFSKGLGAPVGSAVAGSRDFIRAAHRVRKRLGGGMRQAGIIAAGALHALRHHRDRIAEDHQSARDFATIVAGGSSLGVDPSAVETNIVIIDTRPASATAEDVVRTLHRQGVHVGAMDSHAVRVVTHLGVTANDVRQAAEIVVRTYPQSQR